MEGKSLVAVCKPKSMPSVKTVLKYALRDRTGFGESYAQAREIGLRIMEEELLEIADNAGKGETDPKLANAAVQRDRLRIDTRKWVAAKQNPRRYGDRVALAGVEDAPIRVTSDQDAAREIAMLLAMAATRKMKAEREAEAEAVESDGNGQTRS